MNGRLGWGETAIKRLAHVTYGLGQPPPLSPDGVPIIRATNIHRGRITRDNLIFAAKADLPLDRAPLLKYGEVLVVRSGAYTGDSAMVTEEWVGAAPGYDLRVTPQRVEPRFLAHALRSSGVGEKIRLASSRAAQPHLNAEELGEISIDVPPLEEQRRIADFLDAETKRIDEVRLARRRMQELLRLKRERVIENLIDDQGNSHNLVPLKHLVESVTVGIVVTPAAWYVDSGGVPALRGVNVKPGRIDDKDLVHISDEGHLVHRKSRLRAGDLVVVRTGQAGAAAVVPEELDGSNCIDLVIVRPGTTLTPRFAEYLLNSSYAKKRVAEFAVGSIQSHFNVAAMKAMPVPRHSVIDQQRIVAEIDRVIEPIAEAVKQMEKQDQLLVERRQALITAAVTGQFDVTTAQGADA